MTRVRIGLTLLWYLWALLLLVLLIALSLQPRIFGGDVTAAWQWFLPNIMPVLTLVGAGSYATSAAPSGRAAPGALTMLTFAVSVLYLSALSVSLVGTLMQSGRTPLAFLQMTNLWLGPLQGLATLWLGLFFVRKG